MVTSVESNNELVARSGHSNLLVRRPMQIFIFFVGFALMFMFVYNDTSAFRIPLLSRYFIDPTTTISDNPTLESVLSNASMENSTVIITTLNGAWAEPNLMFDLFLKSFHVGIETEKLLKHLVVITLDEKAHARCQALHPHCYQLDTKSTNFTSEQPFMTKVYLDMMWRRTEFLGTVLEMGYNFVFTDTDILWLRNPFNEFYDDADFQIACDYFNGDSSDLNNLPNGGFIYVKSNYRTIWFYKFWINSRIAYPGKNEQDVLNFIKMNPIIQEKKLKIRFLSTTYFSGFCELSKDFNKVCTLHATCCVGLKRKFNNLKILFQDWAKYMELSNKTNLDVHPSWTVPHGCK